jgi:hypothetical protein
LASTRFEKAAQFCSYEHIINTRLDIRENQRLSQESYQQLIQKFEVIKDETAYHNDRLTGAVSEEAAAMRHVISSLTYRMVGLESAVRNFINPQASMSVFIEDHESTLVPRTPVEGTQIQSRLRGQHPQSHRKFIRQATILYIR